MSMQLHLKQEETLNKPFRTAPRQCNFGLTNSLYLQVHHQVVAVAVAATPVIALCQSVYQDWWACS